MDKLKSKIKNIFQRSKIKKGFSLIELIVAVAIMVVLLAVLTPSLIHYVENTRAKKDSATSNEMANAVMVGMSNQDVYDELIKNSVKGNVSCYIDQSSEAGYEKIESSSKYTFDDNARLLDETPYFPAGNMYGVTITFEPKQKSNSSDTEYDLKDGIVNKYVPEKTQLLTENENLYAALRKVVGEKVELNSQTYRNSEMTIFIQIGSRKGSDITTTDAVEVYSQFSGTNLPAETIAYAPTTDRIIDYVYDDPVLNPGGGGGNGSFPDGGGSGSTGGGGDQGHEHNYVASVTSPTCQNRGYTTYTCDCGNSYVDEDSYVDEVGHSYDETITKYATCTNAGTKILKCSICGIEEDKDIPATGHSYKSSVINATCTTNGHTVHTCSKCGDSYKDNETTAGGHQWSEWTTITPADCKNDGLKERKCQLCNNTEEKTIDRIGHNYKKNIVSPTCTSEGYTDNRCENCGDTYIDEKTPVADHTYRDWTINRAPTCESTGEKFKSCVFCEHTLYETVDALGHNYANDYTIDINATCTSHGSKSKHCSKCEKVKDIMEIPALGHDWDEGHETVKPTCDGAGTKVYKCNNCNEIKSEDLNATGHNYKETVTPPTATNEGYTLHTCLNCGLSFKDNFVPKLNVSVSGTVKIFDELKSNITIQLKQDDKILYTVVTDTSGAFEIEEICVGEYTALITYKEVHKWEEPIVVNDNGDVFNFSLMLAAGLYDQEHNLLISWNDLTSMDYYTIPEYEKYVGYDEETYEDIYEMMPASPIISVSEDGTLTTASDDYNMCYYSADAICSKTKLGGYYNEITQTWEYHDPGILVISDTVKKLGDNAFYGFCSCYNDCISTFILPDSIEVIGNSPFCCSTINKIPSSLKSIGDYGFSGTNLIDKTIPSTIESVGLDAFNGFDEFTITKNMIDIKGRIGVPLANITVEDGAPYRIDDNTIIKTSENKLIYCEGDVPIIPDGIEIISKGAFYGMYWDIYDITIPSSVKKIEGNLFANCLFDMENVYVESIQSWCDIEFETISANPFYRNVGNLYIGNEGDYELVTQITLSDNIKNIKNYTFYNCNSIKSVELISDTNFIGEYAFCNSSLNTISGLDNVTYVGEKAFYGTPWLTTQKNEKQLIIAGGAVIDGSKCVGEVVIPDGVHTIQSSAFEGNTNLTSVTIPATVTSIGEDAFKECGNLTNIIVDENNSIYDSRNNCNAIIDTATNTLLYGSSNTIIPNGVTSIADYAFYRSKIASVVIPDSIMSIGKSAFDNCTSLNSVDLGNGVQNIGSSAFYHTPFTNITIPNSVTEIGKYAFAYCYSLSTVDFNANMTSIPDQMFYNSGITEFEIPDTITHIGNNAFGYTKLNSIKIPASVISAESAFSNCRNLYSVEFEYGASVVSRNMFYWCEYLSNVKLPSTIKKIEDYAFGVCRYSLTSIEIPEGIETIGYEAFSNCVKLQSITIPNSVKTIGGRAFISCDSVSSINIPSAVESIGEAAFSAMDNLTSIVVDENNKKYDSRNNCNAIIETNTNKLISGCVNSTIPNGVEIIGDNALMYCQFTSMIIPNSVTRIGESAFQGCSSLTNIEIPNSVTYIDWYAFQSCSNLTSIVIPSSVTYIGVDAFASCYNLQSVYFEHISAPSFGSRCFRYAGQNAANGCTFYFRNGTVYNAFSTSYYTSSYGTKSTNYDW